MHNLFKCVVQNKKEKKLEECVFLDIKLTPMDQTNAKQIEIEI
jgi:hypothetical protein